MSKPSRAPFGALLFCAILFTGLASALAQTAAPQSSPATGCVRVKSFGDGGWSAWNACPQDAVALLAERQADGGAYCHPIAYGGSMPEPPAARQTTAPATVVEQCLGGIGSACWSRLETQVLACQGGRRVTPPQVAMPAASMPATGTTGNAPAASPPAPSGLPVFPSRSTASTPMTSGLTGGK